MGWAAGAMIYICAAELIPPLHGNGSSSKALAAFVVGISAMLFLDIALS
jgi:zinc transporter ZupT